VPHGRSARETGSTLGRCSGLRGWVKGGGWRRGMRSRRSTRGITRSRGRRTRAGCSMSWWVLPGGRGPTPGERLPLLRRSASPRIVNLSSHVGSLGLQSNADLDLGGSQGHTRRRKRSSTPSPSSTPRSLPAPTSDQQCLRRLRDDGFQQRRRDRHRRAGRCGRDPARDPAGRWPHRTALRRRRDRALVTDSPSLTAEGRPTPN